MRLHSLSLVAFGPFPDPVEIDFDTLNAAGVFLLSGATGAGKTSVLDAVAFALYGEVPGDRNTAKRLRSDLADPLTAPEVSAEFSVGARRFRITRSPAWQRAKRRGSGVTTLPARVTCLELIDGAWVTRSTRIDEVGHLITNLLGLTHAQFCQVVILPQGRFQAFLRAGADDRRRLLQRLFHTDRFAAVETWFGDHRRSTRRTAEAAWGAVQWRAGAIVTESSTPCPDDVADYAAWAVGLAAEAAEQATGAVRAAERSQETLQVSESALADALDLEEAQRRWGAAMADSASLQARAPEIDRLRHRVEAGRSAQVLAPLLARYDALDDEHAASQQRALRAFSLIDWDRELAALADEPVTEPLLSELELRLTDQRAELATLRPLLETSAELRAELDRVQTELGDAQRLLAELDQHHLAAHGESAELTQQLDLAREARLALVAATAEREEWAQLVEAARARDALLPRVEEATLELTALHEESNHAKEHWLTLLEERLAGMAGELAGGLAAGCGCPVCGSTSHPQPARLAPGAPDPAAERTARRRSEDASVAYQAAQEAAGALRHQLASLRAQVGERQLAELQAGLEDSTARCTELKTQSGRLASLEQRADELTALLSELSIARDRAEQTASHAAAALDALHVQREALDTELAAAPAWCREGSAPHRLDNREDRLSRCAEALLDWRQAHRTAAAAREAADSAGTAAGFADLESARAAAEDVALLDQLLGTIDAHDQQQARVTVVLSEPELQRAATMPEPDCATLRADVQAARTATQEAARASTLAADRARRLADHSEELAAALAAWRPAAEAAALAADLSGVIEGRHPDNHAQLRLSEFVLAHRLGEVVTAANHRLDTMTDHRYELQHVAAKRGGLTLEVVDAWSGQSRDPATLSGGESFVVSLALALGLADVIAAEAGATALDTLFVDEGFGSLDAETLTDVLDTVDGLREGGRVVGLVSHVPDMRARIPVRLHIDKRRNGSTARLVCDQSG